MGVIRSTYNTEINLKAKQIHIAEKLTSKETVERLTGETESSLWFIQRVLSWMKIGENNGETEEAVDTNEKSEDRDGENNETEESLYIDEETEDEDGKDA